MASNSSCNVAVGEEALFGNRTTGGNTAVGWKAISVWSVTDGGWNTAVGCLAGYGWEHANFNVALGYNCFSQGDGGWGSNVAVGPQAMFNAQGGVYADVAIGGGALFSVNGGQYNAALGTSAGRFLSSGSYNTLVGQDAGVWQNPPNYDDPYYSLTTGSYNTFIGNGAGLASATQRNNATAIGNMAKVDADNALVLGGTGDNAVNVGINTTTPQAKLDVNGGATIRGDATVQGVLRVPPAGDIGMGDFTAGTNPSPQP